MRDRRPTSRGEPSFRGRDSGRSSFLPPTIRRVRIGTQRQTGRGACPPTPRRLSLSGADLTYEHHSKESGMRYLKLALLAAGAAFTLSSASARAPLPEYGVAITSKVPSSATSPTLENEGGTVLLKCAKSQ